MNTHFHRVIWFGVALPSLAIAACSSDSTTSTSATTTTSTGSATTTTTTGGGGAGTGGSGQGGETGQGGHSNTDPACTGAIYCDDFDGYKAGDLPGGKWTANANGGKIAVDSSKAYRGTQSVKISADKSAGYRSIMLALKDKSLLPPTAGNVVYGRMMFWLDSAPEGDVHWTFIDGQGPVAGKGYSAVYRYGGQHPITENGMFKGNQMMANYETPGFYSTPPTAPNTDCYLHADKKVVPTGAWTCAEWHFDGPTSAMQFWMNGTEIPDLAVTKVGQGCSGPVGNGFEWTAPSFEQIDLGWESYQADDARTMWIDDVVISTTRVNCPMP